MKELLTKLSNAKVEIKNTSIKKEGHNTFSNYDYFTPDQIEYLVALACKNNGLLTTFDLTRNEFGLMGILTIYDIENNDKLEIRMATDIPQIKATNTAQQLGGCVTYTERYLKMSAFGITDNRLDFDNSQNTKNQKPQLTEAEKTANWIKNLDDKAELVANAGYDFVTDVLMKCAIDTRKEANELDPSERKKYNKMIDDEISNLKVSK